MATISLTRSPVNEPLIQELADGTGTGKTHLAVAIARACIRMGTRGRCYNVVDLVPDPHINVPVRVLNFPVMFCREFTGKPLVSSGLPPITGPNSPIFMKIPCIFPDYQGIGAETGSQQTAPTASC